MRRFMGVQVTQQGSCVYARNSLGGLVVKGSAWRVGGSRDWTSLSPQ